MEEKNFDTSPVEESVENEQVADVQPREQSVEVRQTRQDDAFFADRRRKQELEESRRRVEMLENQLSHRRQDSDFIDFFNEISTRRAMEEDLREIQSVDPKITTLDDLPPMFYSLRFNGYSPMSAKQAFLAMKAIESQTLAQKPASTGSMGGSGKGDSDYFTSSELDSLTAKDLDNPKVLEKAMRSMARLK